MLLLFLMLGFGFSGYLLPWNELAFFATKVGTDIPGAVPIVGDDIAALPARRRRGHRRDADPLLRPARRHPAGHHDRARRPAPALRAAAGHERAARSVEARVKHGRAPARRCLLPQLRAARHRRLVRRARRAGRPGGVLPVGAGREGRPVRAGAGGHPARVVFPGHVPDAEAPARATCSASKASSSACSAFGALAAVFAGAAVPRPRRRQRTSRARSCRGLGVGHASLYLVVITVLGYILA